MIRARAFRLMRWQLACLAFVSPLFAQAPQPEVFGLLRNDARVYLSFVWEGETWRSHSESVPEGLAVHVVDSAGRSVVGTLGRGADGETWPPSMAYRISGADALIDQSAFWRNVTAYVSTSGFDHAPFAGAESPLSVAEWERLFAAASPPPDDELPDRVLVTLRRAQLGSTSLVYFDAMRQAEVSSGCPTQYRFTGWMSPDVAVPQIATVETGDCEGKGATRRQAVALIVRGGNTYLLVGTRGWEEMGAELWLFADAQLRRVEVR